MGAALLRDPDRLCSILSALVAAVSPPPEQGGFGIGVSVKIRILETIDETRALVERLVATGITGLTVHCRTPPMRPREKAIREDGRLRVVAEVCRAAGVACLVNGDVASREEGELLAREHGVDGAMIAAAAERNPSCFRTAAQGGLASWEEIVRQYLRVAIDTRNRWGNTKFMMQQLVPGKQAVAKGILACKTYTHLVAALGPDVLVTASADGDVTATTMEEWEALAAQADVDLGLDERERLEREAREAKEARIRANSGGGKKAKVGVVKGQDNASAMAAAGSMAEARAADADKSRGKKRSQLSERRVSAVLAAGHEGDERDLEKLSRQHERMVERESAAAVAG